MASYDLGTLRSNIVSYTDYSVTSTDWTDVFEFDITNNRNINLFLYDISTGDDADLRLFRDSNDNGILDSDDQQVASSRFASNSNDFINYSATSGTYFAQVERYASGSNGDISYDLDLAAIYDVGDLTGTSVRRNNYSVTESDSTDVFEFDISNTRNIGLRLQDISVGDDADLRLFSDSNNNGVFDSEDQEVANSRRSGNVDDVINYIATTGTYFAQVERYAYGSDGTVGYDIELSDQTRQLKTFDLDFSVANHSIWGSNTDLEIQDNRFLGASWNERGSKSLAGFGVQGSTSGRIGLESDLNLDGGRLNASLPIDLWLDMPEQIIAGETITIQSGFMLDSTASFSTTGPQASYNLDFIFDVNAAAGLRGFGRNLNLVNFDRDFSRNLLSLDSNNASFSLSERQLNGFGSFDVGVPQISTQSQRSGVNSLSSAGSDEVLNASLDMDRVATTLARTFALPVPDLGGEFDRGIVSASYDLLDFDLNAELNARQAFDLEVDELTGQLVLENGQRIDFTVGEDITFTVPDNIGNSLGIRAVFDLDADFRNRSTLGYDVDASLRALSLDGSVGIDLPGPWDLKKDFGLGPIVNRSYNILDGDIGLYNRTFEIAGIGQQTINFDVPVI